MTIAVIPAPDRRRSGFSTSDVMNFMMGLGSLKEQKQQRLLQEKYLRVAEGGLELEEKKITQAGEQFTAELGYRKSALAQAASQFAKTHGLNVKQFTESVRQFGEKLPIEQQRADALTTQAESMKTRADTEKQQFELTKPSVAAFTELRTRVLKDKIAEYKRMSDLEKAYGKSVGKHPDTSLSYSQLYKSMAKVSKSDPSFAEQIALSDEISKLQSGVVAEQRANIFALQQAFKTLQIQTEFDKQARGAMYSQIGAMAKGGASGEDVAAAMNAAMVGDVATYSNLLAKMQTTIENKGKQPQSMQFDPTSLPSNVIGQYGQGTYQRMLNQYQSNLPYAEIRQVTIPRLLGKDRPINIDYNDAVKMGVEEEWRKSEAIVDPNSWKPPKEPSVRALPDNFSYSRSAPGRLVRRKATEEAKKKKPAGKSNTLSPDTMIKVRRKSDGQPGTIPLKNFDPNSYERIN